jgi:methylenetetrahydrofolate reductase (NADPH)
MVYGPCGGVRLGGGCEVDPALPCVFVDQPVVRWERPATAGGPFAPVVATSSPIIVTDLHVRPRDRGVIREVVALLAGTCDAVLIGDHGGRRNDFPPSFAAEVVVSAGARPWVTLACRDRNRVALAAECAALADVGVVGVHCVTGDWQGLSGDIGERRVFDLDALRLTALAVEHGLAVSVAANPVSPPVGLRPARLAAKAAAGAGTCFINHCGGPAPVARFVAAARRAGADLAYIPCVPVVSDPASVASLARLPGLVLDTAVVEEVARAGWTTEAGVAAAAAEAGRMLEIPGVVGVNLSGAASSRSEAASAMMMADVGRLIRDRVTGPASPAPAVPTGPCR